MNYIAVKQWMLGKGLTIATVAASAGVSPTTVTLTLQNKRFGSYRLVRRALRKFRCPADLLKKEQPKGRRSKDHRRDGSKVHRLEACATGSAPTEQRRCG